MRLPFRDPLALRRALAAALAASLALHGAGALAQAAPLPSASTPSATAAPPANTSRLRFGIESGAGYAHLVSGHQHTYAPHYFSIAVRLGSQVSESFAWYFQPRATFGGALGSDFAGPFLLFSGALMFEYTRADRFHVGVGPAVDLLNAGSPLLGGADVRLAYTTGRLHDGVRRGLSVALDLHPAFNAQLFMLAATLSLGFELY